ncbi:MAG: O-antigen ligase family protein [Symbiobacteriia bacterium]
MVIYPNLALVGMVATIPLTRLAVNTGVFTATLHMAVTLAAVVAIFLGAAQGKRSLRNTPVFMTIALFLLLAFAPTFVSQDPFLSLRRWLNLLYLGASFWAVYQLIPDRRRLLIALHALLWTVLLVSLFGLAQVVSWRLGHPVDSLVFPLTKSSTWIRAESTFADPNMLGGFLIVTLPLIAYWWNGHSAIEFNVPRLWLAAVLVIGVSALALTFSRGALLALAVAFALFGIRHKRDLWLLAAGVVGVFFFIPPQLLNRLMTAFTLQDFSSMERLRLWTEGFSKFAKSPLIGWGLNMFPSVVGAGDTVRAAHNVLVELAVETGILGLATFLASALLYFVSSLRSLRQAPPSVTPLVQGSLIGLAAVFIQNLTIGGLYQPYLWCSLALSLALPRAMVHAEEAVEPALTPSE